MRHALLASSAILVLISTVGFVWLGLADERPASNLIMVVLDAGELSTEERVMLARICREVPSARCVIDVPERAAQELKQAAIQIHQTGLRVKGERQGIR